MQQILNRTSASFTGLILPHEWDNAGQVTAIAILSPGEKEYVIQNEGKGLELFNHIRKPVRVTGRLNCLPSGKHVVNVESYEIIAARAL